MGIARIGGRVARAFSLLEVMVTVTILAILAAVVMPRFDGLSSDARSSAALSAVAGVRSSIAAYRTRQVISGNDPFPTIDMLTEPGVVLQGELPVNPYNGRSNVLEVRESDAVARRVSGDEHGWCYFVRNEGERPTVIIYLNSREETRVSDGNGGFKGANEL